MTGFDTVDIFDASTGQWSQATLSQGRNKLVATTVDGYALFACGIGDGAISGTVDIFTPEPATLLMLGFGALGLLSRRRARQGVR